MDYSRVVEYVGHQVICFQVFHGAARLIQPGSATSAPQGHTAARRALNPAPVNVSDFDF